MSSTSITQTLVTRKDRALAICAMADTIEKVDAEHWIVRSQSNPANAYHVTLLDPAHPERASCECPDNGYGHTCKHILAAGISLAAERKARALAEQHKIGLAEVASRIEADLLHGLPSSDLSTRLLIILHATNRLIAAHCAPAQEITLIVRYRTYGGRTPTTHGEGEITAIIEDGREREPKSNNLNRALSWLMGKGYIPMPDGRKWIDPPGLIRRRRETFVASTTG